MDNVIEIKGLSKSYKNRNVLNALSLSVPKGAVYGLLGRNGSGKTTLIKTVLGLLKYSSGSLSVLSDNPWAFRDVTKERLGYVPQSDRLYPWLTVGQLIDYTASFYAHWNQELIARLVREWRVDLKDKVGLLSEGQAQKVSIILSLGHEPELLVFDEPVASLDPAARRQFLKTIVEIVSERPCTIFFSTHITSDLERVADHVAILNDGGIAFSGGLDDLKDEVKRLRIFAKKKFPPDFTLDGAIHCEHSDHEVIASVRNFHPELKKRLEDSWDAEVHIENLNLEEIFLELSR